MKRLIALTLLLTFYACGFAQVPQGFNYQSVIRDNGGAIMANQSITFRFAFREGSASGTYQYRETISTTTDEFGNASAVVGTGTATLGNWNSLTWASESYWLEVAVQIGSGSFIPVGTSQLMSVPYALASGNSSPWTESNNNIENTNSGRVSAGSPSWFVSSQLQAWGSSKSAFSSMATGTGNLEPGSRFWSEGTAEVVRIDYGATGGNRMVTFNRQGNEQAYITTEGIAHFPTYFAGNLAISDLGSDNLGLNGDIIPFSSTSYDLGNNVSGEHWDEVVANSFVTFSDRRAKQNITDLHKGLSEVMQLRPVTYQYISKIDPAQRQRLGLIAQEVKEIVPEAVVTEDIDINPETGEIQRKKGEYIAMNYQELLPVLINAIQEQQDQIEALKAEIVELKAK